MRILDLHAINYKGIEDVHIVPDPDQNVILITGKNDQGKTSTIDSIWAALKGAEVSKLTEKPRRNGEKRASVRLDLGEYIVLREWHKDDIGTLTITSPRGAVYTSPQKILDGLVAKFTMDPLGFTRLKGKEQIETLVAMLGDALGFDPVEIEQRRKDADGVRRIENATVSGLQARLKVVPEFPADANTETVSVRAIMEELAEAQLDNERAQLTRDDVASLESELVDAEQAIIAAQKHRDTVVEELAEAKVKAEALPEPIDLDEIRGRIDGAEEANAQVNEVRARRTMEFDLAEASLRAKEQDDILEAIKKEKRDALAAVTFPVDGMTFDLESETVLVNDVPLAQMSGKGRRNASLAMAAAMNPELRVIRVDEGESYDEDALADIYAWAAEKDFQIWMTRVGVSDDASAVVIHEGKVVA